MKGKVKSIAIFLVLIMVFNIFAPTMKVFAEGAGGAEGTTYTAKVSLGNGEVNDRNVTYKVDDTTKVVLTLEDGIVVDNNQIVVTVDRVSGEIKGITVESLFDTGTIEIKLSKSDGFKAYLNVDENGKLKLNNVNASISADDGVTLNVQKIQDNPNPPQPGGTITVSLGSGTVNVNEGKVTYNVDGTDVVLTLATDIVVDMSNNKKQIVVEVDSQSREIKGITVEKPFDNTMEITLSGSNDFCTKLNVEDGKIKLNNNANIRPEDVVTLNVQKQTSGGDNTNPQPGENDDYEDIKVNAKFNNSQGEIKINGTRVTGDKGEVTSYNGTATKVGYTDPSQKNTITITTGLGWNFAGKITINGTEYEVNHTDSNEIEVPGATNYKIVVDGTTTINVPQTIIWGNPGVENLDDEDALIHHGSAKIIAVYDEDGNKMDYTDYTNQDEQPDGSKSDEYGLTNGYGWAKVSPGSKVVFEFIPEYGYQLTKVEANEEALEPQSTINQYVFTMPNTNVHFSATFTKTDDIVKAESEKVSSGEISLGNTLEGGTAQLTVNDVELSQDKITGFENAAGDYTISNYLDINLYNVFYKGKSDSDDVWSNKIDELDNEATITLKLAEGVNVDDIVIVHNIHDGDEFEVIEIESYDAETNTITFKTKSFSNYAIATKASSNIEKEDNSSASSNDENNSKIEKEDNSLNPTTGDNIITITIIFAIALFGAFTTIKLNKNRRVRKH